MRAYCLLLLYITGKDPPFVNGVAIDRGLRCLQQIQAAGLDPPLRIPKLRGVVESGNDTFSGIFIINIPPHPVTPALGLADLNAVAISRRKEWASQIGDTIGKLHDVGVVWGDANADKIPIDRNDDTWVTDFGSTQNWRIAWRGVCKVSNVFFIF